MRDKELVSIIKVLAYLALISPLIIGGFISPFYFGKTVFFRIVVEIMALAYLILFFKNQSYRPPKGFLMWAVAMFVASALVSSFLGVNPYQSFWGEPTRMGGVITLLHLLVLFIVLSSVLTRRDILGLLSFSVKVALLVVLYALGQKLELGFLRGFDATRPYGTIGNAALFAGYALFNVFFAAYFYALPQTGRKEKYFYAAFIFLAVLAIYFTAVRGALLALVAGAAVFFIFLLGRRAFRYLALAGFLLVFLLAAVFLTPLKNTAPIKKLTDPTTLNARLDGWTIAFEGWKEKPIFGWGPENFNAVFNIHFNPNFFHDSRTENYWDRAHNIFFEVASTQGLFGLGVFLALLAAAFWSVGRNNYKYRYEPALLYAVLVAYIVHTFFIFDSLASLLMLFLVLSFIVAKEEILIKVPKTQAKNRPVLAALTAVAIFSALYFINIKPIIADGFYKKGQAFYSSEPRQSMEYFDDAVAQNTPEQFEIRRRYARLVLARSDFSGLTGAEDIIVNQDEMERAIKYMLANLEQNKFNVFDYMYLGSLYNHYGRLFQAPDYFERNEQLISDALNLFLGRQQLYYILADAKLGQGNNSEAIDILNEALSLNPKSSESHWRLALAFYSVGDIDAAQKHLERSDELIYLGTREYIPDILKGVEISAAIQDYGRLVYFYKTAIGLRPDYAQFPASLAAVYKEIGDIENARIYAQKAAEIDSSFKEEAELFIKSLSQ